MLLRRLRPPRVAYTPELRWLLLRAFGPLGTTFGAPLESDRVVELAATYNLAPRIVTRHPGHVVNAELGREHATQLVVLQLADAARTRRLVRFIPHLAERAAALVIPIVFLKFAALYLDGVISPDGRPAVDLDILVRPSDASRLALALTQDGFSTKEVGPIPHEFHLPPLSDARRGVTIEIHGAVRGLRLDARRTSPDLDDLQANALLRPVASLPGECFSPTRDVQLAYLLIHGLAQHGHATGSYPLFRLVSDLIDLDAARLLSGDTSAALRWTQGYLSKADIEATGRLVSLLACGDERLFSAREHERPARVILDHLIAGPTNQDYRNALALDAIHSPPSDLAPHRSVGRRLLATVFLSRQALDDRYGRPSSEFGYVVLRLFRPFDLLFRVGPRMLARAIKHRRSN